MSASVLQSRSRSIPWIGSRKPKATAPDIKNDKSASTHSDKSAQSAPQTATLLTLPLEIQHKIFSHFTTPWTMADMSPIPQYSRPPDPTLNLTRVNGRYISGPPAASLLLVCRTLYHNFLPFYGSNCTGVLVLGKVKGFLRLGKSNRVLSKHSNLRQFYSQIHTISVAFALSALRMGIDFRALFPNLKRADCVVHEGSYGPFLRMWEPVDRFMQGHHDQQLLEWTAPTVKFFLEVKQGNMEHVYDTSCPWDDEEAIVDVKVLMSKAGDPNCVLGCHYRWEGSRVSVISRAVRKGTELRIWEAGTRFASYGPNVWHHDSTDPRFQWVQALKW